jgi:hypothetical protein
MMRGSGGRGVGVGDAEQLGEPVQLVLEERPGPRVDALSVRRRRGAETANPAPAERGAWYRIAHSVMRRPVLYDRPPFAPEPALTGAR